MPEAQEIEKAVKLLRLGEVVALPTETVYGLAARVDFPRAVEKIFTVKERPFFDPLIVHVASLEQARQMTSHWGPVAEALAAAFWPGPLTLVLPKAESVNPMITSGLETVGLRMPDHAMTLQVIQELGVPVAAPSANKFGKTSPTEALHVWKEFEKENVFVLDGGPCAVGIESTVLSVKEGEGLAELAILRKGRVLRADIEALLSREALPFRFVETVSPAQSPGHMKHHYMPAVPLIVCESRQWEHDELLNQINQRLLELPDIVEGVRIVKPSGGIEDYRLLDLAAEPTAAARELYADMRRLAEEGASCLVFYREAFHRGEAWEGLLDRLYKAASLILP